MTRSTTVSGTAGAAFGLALAVTLFAACVAAGSTASPRIVGGQPAPPGAYPFAVAFVAPGQPERESKFCGGSLIAERTVLTAAHCMGRTPDQFEAVVGRDRLGDTASGQRIGIDRWATYKRIDIAIVRLQAPAAVAPVSLATDADAPLFADGMPGTAIGWGVKREGAKYGTDELREVEVPFVSDDACAKAYRPAKDAGPYERFSARTNVCAGATGRDACQGDSGGPLLVADAAGAHLQVGVTSFGEGCGRAGFPGVYTEVPALLGFIQDPDPVFAPIPVRQKAAIKGTARVGRRLTCLHGKWTGEDVGFSYSWLADGNEIALGRRLKLKPRLEGKSVSCIVRGKTAGGSVRVGSGGRTVRRR